MNKKILKAVSFGAEILPVLALILILATPACARPLDPILPLAKVKPGMTGYAKTVFSGLKVQKFPIVVKSILPGAGMSGEALILIELTGTETDKCGGVAMGMSGSPVYINDKLIGALALTFPNTDHKLGGVTPIEIMLKITDRDKQKTSVVPLEKTFEYKGKKYDRINYGRAPAGPGALEAHFALAPIAVRGISARTFPLVRKFFEESGIEVAPIEGLNSGGAPLAPSIRPASLEPGSSVSVQLVRGDIDISAAGTLTAVDGDNVLMFGHPFFRKGAVNYLLADAYVHTIVNSAEMPYKLVSTAGMRGEVLQDRGSALFGKLNIFPEMIPLKVTVTDRDIDKTKSFSFEVVKDNDILINLIVMAVLQSLDNTIDRIGSGTSEVSFTINCEGCAETVKRDNIYFDKYDISARSLTELIGGLSIVQDNMFTESSVTKLDISLTVDNSNKFAAIEDADLIQKKEPAAGLGSSLKPEASSVDEDTTTDEDSAGEEDVPEIEPSAEDAEPATGTVAPDSATDTEYIPDDSESDNSDNEDSYPDVQFKIDTGDGDAPDAGESPDNGNAPEDETAPDGGARDDQSAPGDSTPGGDSAKDKNNDRPETSKSADKQKLPGAAQTGKSKKPVPTVRPGEKLAIKVQLRPYRQNLIDETIFLKVPDDIPPGNGVIDIYSGTKQREAFTLGDFLIKLDEGSSKVPRDQEDGEDSDNAKEKEKSFAELIKKFNERDHNNELVATISSFGYSFSSDREGEDNQDIGADDDSKNKAKKQTGWFLQGSTSIKVKIAGKEQPTDAFKSRTVRKSKINKLQDKNGGDTGKDKNTRPEGEK